jgi:biopolymer transport protein ExbD
MTGHPSRARALGVLALVTLASLAACDDKSKSGGSGGVASAAPTASTTTAEAPAQPKPKTMPSLIVDSLGPYIGIERVDMKNEKWPEKLAALIKDLPINGNPVTLIADKKAKTPDVAAVVAELGRAGAPKVVIKTDGRDDVPKELTVVPPDHVQSPPGCSVVTMVSKDLSTAVWPFKGGLGRKHRKGLAGPDLSNTADSLKKDIATCESTMAFFSADDTVQWEMAYNLAGTLLNADEKKKVQTLVLLEQSPVGGRAVKLTK